MKLLKDLLYGPQNKALDTARLQSLASMIAFWTGIFILLAQRGGFDPVAVGTGCAALMAGSGAFIFAKDKAKVPPPKEEPNE